MTDQELMQQALDALEDAPYMSNKDDYGRLAKTITALDKRLAQPEQEPVAWMTITDYGDEDDIWYENPEGHLLEGWTYKPLYLHPPEVQSEPLEYWNAVEGWVKIDEVRQHFDSVGCGTIYKSAGEDRVPLYTTPPQRPWVGLTDEEVSDLWCKVSNADFVTVDTHEFARAVDDKLRSKNT